MGLIDRALERARTDFVVAQLHTANAARARDDLLGALPPDPMMRTAEAVLKRARDSERLITEIITALTAMRQKAARAQDAAARRRPH